MKLLDVVGKQVATDLKEIATRQEQSHEASSFYMSRLVNSFLCYVDSGLDKLKSEVCEDCIMRCSFSWQMKNIHNRFCVRKEVTL